MENKHAKLDELKRLTALAILEDATITAIRAKSLANLDRWNANGVWVSAHDEWRTLMISGTDEQIIATLSGRDQHSNRLRQTPPYVGLIHPDTRRALRERLGFEPISNEVAARAARVLAELDKDLTSTQRLPVSQPRHLNYAKASVAQIFSLNWKRKCLKGP